MAFPTFAAWAALYNKVYDGEEATSREAIYNANVAMYSAHNDDTTQTFTMGVNQFSDLTNDEFRATYASGLKGKSARPRTAYLGEHKYEGEELADSLDWAAKGAVTPVKDQGQCGSCWAFSTTGSLEGASEIASGQLKSISEQQLVDCSGSYGNQGCNGGLMDDGFEFAEANAMATEASYPYTARDGSCKTSFTTALPKGAVTGYKDVTAKSVDAMMSALQLGPVSIALDGGGSAFQGYKSGVLTGSCGSQLDHGVLTVGYGTLNGEDYWKVKNSWGTSWGMDGYILLTRTTGTFKKSVECGMLSEPSYPVVSESVLKAADRPDCSAAACQANCECSYVKCSAQVDACLAAPNCASSQDCAFACACGDGACLLKCAASSPSIKALPLAKCITSNCDASVQV